MLSKTAKGGTSSKCCILVIGKFVFISLFYFLVIVVEEVRLRDGPIL